MDDDIDSTVTALERLAADSERLADLVEQEVRTSRYLRGEVAKALQEIDSLIGPARHG